MGMKNLRMALGLNQQELALLLGISRSQVGMVEAGRRVLPYEAGKALAQLQLKLGSKTLEKQRLPKPTSKPRASQAVPAGLMKKMADQFRQQAARCLMLAARCEANDTQAKNREAAFKGSDNPIALALGRPGNGRQAKEAPLLRRWARTLEGMANDIRE